MTLNIMTFSIGCPYAELRYVVFRDYLNAMLSVIMLNAIMLIVLRLNVIMLNVDMLNVIMLRRCLNIKENN